jgi:S1-C subfamily serine protease
VVEGSPAEAAGLKAGDGLVRIGEGQIGNINSLTAILAGYNQGDKATIVITRDGAEKSLEITFGR